MNSRCTGLRIGKLVCPRQIPGLSSRDRVRLPGQQPACCLSEAPSSILRFPLCNRRSWTMTSGNTQIYHLDGRRSLAPQDALFPPWFGDFCSPAACSPLHVSKGVMHRRSRVNPELNRAIPIFQGPWPQSRPQTNAFNPQNKPMRTEQLTHFTDKNTDIQRNGECPRSQGW